MVLAFATEIWMEREREIERGQNCFDIKFKFCSAVPKEFGTSC